MLRSNAEVPRKKEREIQETAEQVDCSAKKDIFEDVEAWCFGCKNRDRRQ
jgi:hypothetical protein